MAIVSVGYDGTVDEAQWAQMVVRVGASEYGVVGAGDFAASVTTGDRAVSISSGVGWGQGVMDASDSDVTVILDPVASGSRWDLVCLRRDWRPPGGSTVVQVVKGGATKQIPVDRIWGNAGNQDDQPLWLIRVQAGSSAVQELVDLRCWGRNGGVFANDDLARSYLGGIGGVVNVNGTVWQRVVGANSVASWVRLFSTDDTGWINAIPTGGWGGEGSYFRYRRSQGRVEIRGRVKRTATFVQPVPSDGNIENRSLFSMPPGFRPIGVSASLTSGAVGPTSSYAVEVGGDVTICSVAPGTRLVEGFESSFSGTYLLD